MGRLGGSSPERRAPPGRALCPCLLGIASAPSGQRSRRKAAALWQAKAAHGIARGALHFETASYHMTRSRTLEARTRRVTGLALALGATLSVRPVALAAQYLTAQDVLSADPVEPDFVRPYGSEPRQIGHLRVPAGSGPFPVLVVIHGGCWRSFADLEHIGPFAEDLTRAGVATWSIDYRPVDGPGGGWPGTFLDIARGVDHLRTLEADHHLDLNRVVVVGHSAGGHLALWAAGRPKIPEGSPLYSSAPLPIRAVVSLAGPGRLASFRDIDDEVCGGDVIDQLMGGSPEDVARRYDAGSPFRLLPLGVTQRLLTGADDRTVPPRFADAYAASARQAGDDATAVTLDGASHFEVIVPGTSVWPEVRSTILTLFDPPPSSTRETAAEIADIVEITDIEFVRTPDHRFEGLPDFPFAAHYAQVPATCACIISTKARRTDPWSCSSTASPPGASCTAR